ncbi:MAG: hypothetical protein DCC67_12480 [Planctomycetota bacterium]|nr:MAG: hypothetical protein DCC67_12480 [Planctomycetota bacterium]
MLFFLGAWAASGASPPLAAATLILESATMGPAGQGSGVPISSSHYIGWRFRLTKKTALTQVGGHLGGISGEMFAAVVSLAGNNATPQGAPFTDTEVVAKTKFTATLPTGDIRVPLEKVLSAGSYALVIGSGQFEAKGTGVAPNGQQTNIAPTLAASYIAWRQTLPGRFEWTVGSLNNVRLAVIGSEIAGAADFNFDNQINGSDLAIWSANFGGPAAGGSASGDAEADADVDGADFLAWQRTVTPPAPAGPAVPAPEPTALGVALAAGVLLAGRRR